MEESMLTTIDNPYDPFSQWDEWYSFDESKGYNTCGYLARIVATLENSDELDELETIQKAIDEIMELNVLGIYKKVENKTELKDNT